MSDLEILALIKAILKRPIAFYPIFFDITQDLNAAIFLSQLWYWSNKMNFEWIYKSAYSWQKETKLSAKQQRHSRKLLKKLGILEECLKKIGGAPIVHFRFNLYKFLSLAQEFVNQKEPSAKPINSPIRHFGNNPNVPNPLGNIGYIHNIDKEITTENTNIEDNPKGLSRQVGEPDTPKIDVIPYQEIVDYFNQVGNTQYRSSGKAIKGMIRARWKDGFRLEDFKRVIDNMADKWLVDDKMSQFFRPSTLFGTKFESYLNQPVKKKSQYSF